MSTCKRMWTDREIRSMAVDSVEEKEKLEVFEHIVDKDGHPRFIEGDINLKDGSVPTKTYGKWSLSGSHLMLVLGLSANENDVITAGTIASIELPSWIAAKLTPLFGNNISYSVQQWYANDGTSQDNSIYLDKTDNVLGIYLGSITMTKDRNIRIQFDLIIDNE